MRKVEFSSSYRLQLTSKFTFKQALEILPYLKELGIEMIYMSPYFAIEEGSRNPYKIISTERIHGEFGDEEDFYQFCRTCAEMGIRHMIDFVPNHMGMTPKNPWIYDILKNGKKSKYAGYFDIDWEWGRGKLRVPCLGSTSSVTLVGEEINVDGVCYPVCEPEKKNPSKKLTLQKYYDLIAGRDAAHLVNYRRFFDIAELIGVREENPDLYRDLHSTLFRWIKEGFIQGIRIDHPDGIYSPKDYLTKLREDTGEKIYLVVEKILQSDEPIRSNWPVDGSVGYEILNTLNAVFFDPAAEGQIDALYREFTKESEAPEDLLTALRENYMKKYLFSEINMLSEKLAKVAASRAVKISEHRMQKGLIAFCARFPIYRSYIGPEEGDIEERDLEVWKQTVERMPPEDEEVRDFFRREIFHLDYREIVLAMQTRMPAFFAKGFEDTFLYRYLRMSGLNEVGSNPIEFGISPEVFHRRNLARFKRCPATMVTTSTHDTKRSLDARMRLSVLSEMPKRFRELLYALHAHAPEFPWPTAEYLFYQSLIAIWPDMHPTPEARSVLELRLSDYMIKAMREGKKKSDWLAPNEKFEKALLKAIHVLTIQKEEDPFWQNFYPIQKEIVKGGRIKSLSTLVLKLGLFGVCDFYQGEELWQEQLVDPDNRGEVNFVKRGKMLEELRGKEESSYWFERAETGHIKMHLMKTLLAFRRQERELFVYGEYIPIFREDGKSIAFRRKYKNREVHVEVPRFSLTAADLRVPEGFKNVIFLDQGETPIFIFAKNF